MTTLFEQKAPGIMRRLMADFSLDVDSAAAIVGNLGHESAGFKFLQEIKPLVPGSAGGYGWAQWTGPRRRAYEGYCKSHNLDPASDAANYGYLAYELHATETSAIPAVKRAETLHEKVVAFELAFERAAPQYKGYPSREKYATLALAAYRPDAAIVAAPQLSPAPAPLPVTPIALPAPAVPAQTAKHDGIVATVLAAILAAAAAAYQWAMEHLPEIFIGTIVLVVVALAAFRLIKGRWPWTGLQSLTSSLPSLLSSEVSLEALSRRLAGLSGASPATPLPALSAPRPRRTQSRKKSKAIRTRAKGSRSSKRSTRMRSSAKRKSRSKA